jgi:hypothetical protein
MKIVLHICLLLIVVSILNNPVYSQELEPRSLTNLPIGTNFVGAGYGYASGSVLLDPALPLDDLDAKLNTFFAAYVHSFNFFGLSAKVDAIVPFATGDWSYNYKGVDESDLSNGFGDARFRFSFNFVGAPALHPEKYKDYKQKTIVGYSIQVIVPTGNYKADQLPNLGSNRWTFKNQVGISYIINKWILEGYVSLWLFTGNQDFLNGNKLNQDPLYAIKAHVIRSLPKKFWIAFGIGYGYGGRSYINDQARDVLISTMRLGLTLAIPIAAQHSLKLVGVTGIKFKQGPDFDAISLSYQFRWNKK